MSSSPEYKAMINCADKLILVFKSDLIDIAAKLLSKGLISQDRLEEMNVLAVPEKNRACTLVSAVTSKVKESPQLNFSKLCGVLSSNPEFYEDILKELTDALESMQISKTTALYYLLLCNTNRYHACFKYRVFSTE